jgi:hypothetical protein
MSVPVKRPAALKRRSRANPVVWTTSHSDAGTAQNSTNPTATTDHGGDGKLSPLAAASAGGVTNRSPRVPRRRADVERSTDRR